jgi:excisionase family DNA binding protein
MTTATRTERFLTRDETAAMLRVCVQTLDRYVKDGRVPSPVRVGRKLLFDAEELRRHLATAPGHLRRNR